MKKLKKLQKPQHIITKKTLKKNSNTRSNNNIKPINIYIYIEPLTNLCSMWCPYTFHIVSLTFRIKLQKTSNTSHNQQ